ncbi:cytochrome c/c1 heme-lyase [Pavlovales sp. CCMP2436]|nr:cytochrome c/c1 heme-lyase [Pavlovales sp. CCMP2436]
MFFNAMRRKGWDPTVEDMAAVVQIHNAVNERAWHQVLVWERLHESVCDNPRLVRFQGKPTEPTPKARVMQLLGYAPPFDRHDWVVDRCGTEVSYLIDFYRGKSRDGYSPSFHIDARPVIDSPSTFMDRAMMPLYKAFGVVKAN